MANTNIHPALNMGIHFDLGAWHYDMEHITRNRVSYFCTLNRQAVMIDEDEFYKAFRKYLRETSVANADHEARARMQAVIEAENPYVICD